MDEQNIVHPATIFYENALKAHFLWQIKFCLNAVQIKQIIIWDAEHVILGRKYIPVFNDGVWGIYDNHCYANNILHPLSIAPSSCS